MATESRLSSLPRDPVQARIGEEYNVNSIVARFQFLVKTGGGVNLFNTMKEACQLYIKERLKGRTDECVVQMWKVFSESAGRGRSDSCVVYLTEPYTRPSVADLVENYIWPRVKGFVEDRLELIGFFRIGGKPIWALNLTQVSPQEQMACLGTLMLDSAGQCMGTVLGKAFAEAVKISMRRKKSSPRPNKTPRVYYTTSGYSRGDPMIRRKTVSNAMGLLLLPIGGIIAAYAVTFSAASVSRSSTLGYYASCRVA